MVDDVAELMRRTDPARTAVDDRQEVEIQAALLRIAEAPVAPTESSTRYRWPWLALPAVAAAVTVLAVLIQTRNPPGTVAHATTPPLLPLSQSPLSIGGALDRAMSQLASQSAREPERRSTFEGWYLQTEVDADGRPNSVITPQRHTIEWNDDLSGRLTVTAGESIVPTDGATPAADGAAPPPGTVLLREDYPPGQMPVLFQSAPASVVDDMREYLAAAVGIDHDLDAVTYLDAIRVLMSEWTLAPAQHAAILQVIRDAEGLGVAGEVVDRLGRPGVALRATSPTSPHFEYLLIVSSETGRILALETIYLGGRSDLVLRTPCVIDYIAWT